MSDPDRLGEPGHDSEFMPEYKWTEAELKARRGRSIALALGLVLFVVLVFVVTLVRLRGNAVQPF